MDPALRKKLEERRLRIPNETPLGPDVVPVQVSKEPDQLDSARSPRKNDSTRHDGYKNQHVAGQVAAVVDCLESGSPLVPSAASTPRSNVSANVAPATELIQFEADIGMSAHVASARIPKAHCVSVDAAPPPSLEAVSVQGAEAGNLEADESSEKLETAPMQSTETRGPHTPRLDPRDSNWHMDSSMNDDKSSEKWDSAPTQCTGSREIWAHLWDNTPRKDPGDNNGHMDSSTNDGGHAIAGVLHAAQVTNSPFVKSKKRRKEEADSPNVRRYSLDDAEEMDSGDAFKLDFSKLAPASPTNGTLLSPPCKGEKVHHSSLSPALQSGSLSPASDSSKEPAEYMALGIIGHQTSEKHVETLMQEVQQRDTEAQRLQQRVWELEQQEKQQQGAEARRLTARILELEQAAEKAAKQVAEKEQVAEKAREAERAAKQAGQEAREQAAQQVKEAEKRSEKAAKRAAEQAAQHVKEAEERSAKAAKQAAEQAARNVKEAEKRLAKQAADQEAHRNKGKSCREVKKHAEQAATSSQEALNGLKNKKQPDGQSGTTSKRAVFILVGFALGCLVAGFGYTVFFRTSNAPEAQPRDTKVDSLSSRNCSDHNCRNSKSATKGSTVMLTDASSALEKRSGIAKLSNASQDEHVVEQVNLSKRAPTRLAQDVSEQMIHTNQTEDAERFVKQMTSADSEEHHLSNSRQRELLTQQNDDVSTNDNATKLGSRNVEVLPQHEDAVSTQANATESLDSDLQVRLGNADKYKETHSSVDPIASVVRDPVVPGTTWSPAPVMRHIESPFKFDILRCPMQRRMSAAAAVCLSAPPHRVWAPLLRRMVKHLVRPLEADVYVASILTANHGVDLSAEDAGTTAEFTKLVLLETLGPRLRGLAMELLVDISLQLRKAESPFAEAVGTQGNAARTVYWAARCHDLLRRCEIHNGPYQWVVFSRSDYFWASPHPPLTLLPPNRVWIPEGSMDFNGGVMDSHAVAGGGKLAAIYAGRWQSLLNGSATAYFRPARQPRTPPESPPEGLEHYMAERLLRAHLRHHRVPIGRYLPVAHLVCCEGPAMVCWGTKSKCEGPWTDKEVIQVNASSTSTLRLRAKYRHEAREVNAIARRLSGGWRWNRQAVLRRSYGAPRMFPPCWTPLAERAELPQEMCCNEGSWGVGGLVECFQTFDEFGRTVPVYTHDRCCNPQQLVLSILPEEPVQQSLVAQGFHRHCWAILDAGTRQDHVSVCIPLPNAQVPNDAMAMVNLFVEVPDGSHYGMQVQFRDLAAWERQPAPA